MTLENQPTHPPSRQVGTTTSPTGGEVGNQPTTVTRLTPPGTGAIAAITLAGPRAWKIATQHFRPAVKPLPDSPPLHRVYFGHLGDGVGDEVILAVKRVEPDVELEFHCHGGQRIVQWLIELLLANGAVEGESDSELANALSRAPTLRTANILLDQMDCSRPLRGRSGVADPGYNNGGAFERLVREISTQHPLTPNPSPAWGEGSLKRLASLAPLGRHLIEPWKIVIAGPPNVGKSSLINALAGYQRSIVAPIPGTTRDVVSVQVAFDGWPVELSDTAGQRESTDALETEGIKRAKGKLAEADLILWVKDATEGNAEAPPTGLPTERMMVVWNKVDLTPLSPGGRGVGGEGDDTSHTPSPPTPLPPGERGARVSATTGLGIPELIAACVTRLIPATPQPGEAVPYLPGLAAIVEAAWDAHQSGNSDFARAILRTCLSVPSQESNRTGV